VPVVTTHSLAVHAVFQNPVSVSEALKALHDAPSVVVLDDLDVECAASVLVSRGWRVLPIAIVTSGNRTARRRAGELFSAMPPALVYSAPHDSVHRWVGEISVTAPIRLRLGDVDLQIRVVGERLDVQAAPRAPPASERPGSPS
jgi:hypothetical protein